MSNAYRLLTTYCILIQYISIKTQLQYIFFSEIKVTTYYHILSRHNNRNKLNNTNKNNKNYNNNQKCFHAI